ncbi:MAG: ABC transporter substrate-binding protein [Thermoleophilia bacterium]|nr:ABC transporter substrate-binding protein [Thermoleophilia bacterium]
MKKTKLLFLLLVILGVVALTIGVVGCGEGGTTETTAAPGETTSSTAGTDSTTATTASGPDTTAAAGQTGTIKIGLLTNKGWPLGVNFLKNMDVWKAMVNDAGGFDVAGTKYMLEMVSYDHTGDQAQAISYMNRLIFEDKVQYVFSDPSVVDPLVPLAEKNSVIYCTSFPTEALTNEANNFAFLADGMVAASGLIPNWLSTAYPGKNKMIVIYPDSDMGHIAAETGGGTVFLKALGFELTQIFVPANQTDMSSIGTKIASTSPDFVMCQATGDAVQGSVFNSAITAGYTGLFVNGGTQAIDDARAFISAEALENMIQFAADYAMDPPASAVAQAFKDEWIKQNGNFESGSLAIGEAFTPWLIAAMQKAGSVDPTALGPVIKDGLEWQAGCATLRMIGKNKQGPPTHQVMINTSTLKVEDGEGVVMEAISLEQMIEWYYANVAALEAAAGN